ncbi:MAG: ParA family protein [Caldisericaceae bacterium]|nr:ParA family protein [Caldisericaceae bacterium]
MQILAIINNKGGVGKTTSAVNLAAAFAEKGKKTLLVDLDPAASASLHLGMDRTQDEQPTICDYLLNGAQNLKNYIYPTAFQGLDCVPSEPALSEFYEEMVQEAEIDYFIKPDDFPDKYDFVFLDCPPNLGNLAYNALAISDFVLIPVQTQFLALTGLELTLKTVQKVQRHLNPDLQILGYFGTQFDRRTRAAKEVVQLLNKRFGKEVFRTVIGVNTKLVEAYNAQKPILSYASSARGAKEYRALADEILKRLKKKSKV